MTSVIIKLVSKYFIKYEPIKWAILNVFENEPGKMGLTL